MLNTLKLLQFKRALKHIENNPDKESFVKKTKELVVDYENKKDDFYYLANYYIADHYHRSGFYKEAMETLMQAVPLVFIKNPNFSSEKILDGSHHALEADCMANLHLPEEEWVEYTTLFEDSLQSPTFTISNKANILASLAKGCVFRGIDGEKFMSRSLQFNFGQILIETSKLERVKDSEQKEKYFNFLKKIASKFHKKEIDVPKTKMKA